jgi:hypothetical protein
VNLYLKETFGKGVELTPVTDDYLHRGLVSGTMTIVLIDDPFDTDRRLDLLDNIEGVTLDVVLSNAIHDVVNGTDDGYYEIYECGDEKSHCLYEMAHVAVQNCIIPFNRLVETGAEVYGVYWTSVNTVAIVFIDDKQELSALCRRSSIPPTLPRVPAELGISNDSHLRF